MKAGLPSIQRDKDAEKLASGRWEEPGREEGCLSGRGKNASPAHPLPTSNDF